MTKSALASLLCLSFFSACARHEAAGTTKGSPAATAPEESLTFVSDAEPPQAKALGKDPDGCAWVRSDVTITAGGMFALNQVKAAAVGKARQVALQSLGGVRIENRFINFQQETLRNQARVTESMLLASRSGRILKEKEFPKGYVPMPGCDDCRYRMVLESCITPMPDYHDSEFKVAASIRPRTDLQDGDPVTLEATAGRDCFVYLYDVYERGAGMRTELVLPNDVLAEVKLKAGEAWTYPDDAVKKRGVRFSAQLPEGKPPISTETLRLIATKSPLPKKLYDPSEGYEAVYKRLNAAGIDWAEADIPFTIEQRQ